MKYFIAVLGVLVPIFAFAADGLSANDSLEMAVKNKNTSAMSNAIADGATNVDSLLRQVLRNNDFDYNVAMVLVENSNSGISATTIDDLYVRYIRIACTTGLTKSQEKIMSNMGNLAPWDYKVSDRAKREFATIAAFRDDDASIAQCVLTNVAKYKLAGGEFLDIAQQVADQYDAKNLHNTIAQIRAEMEKIKSAGGQ